MMLDPRVETALDFLTYLFIIGISAVCCLFVCDWVPFHRQEWLK